MSDSGTVTAARGDDARPAGPPRGNPFTRVSVFIRQVLAELRKVIWPTRKEPRPEHPATWEPSYLGTQSPEHPRTTRPESRT